MSRVFIFCLLMMVIPVITSAQNDNVLPLDTPITVSNLENLQRVTEFEHSWPLELIWSPDSVYLAVNTPAAVWIHDLTHISSIPLDLPPTAISAWDNFGSVMFSPASDQVATVEPTNANLQLRSLIDSEQRLVEIDTNDYTGVAAISPDLTRWATAHWDGSIVVWDAQTGDSISRLEGHIRIGDLAFTSDSSILISDGGATHSGIGDEDNTVRLWDIATGELLERFEVNPVPSGYGGPTSDIAVTSDDSTASVFSFDETDNGDLAGIIHMIDIPSRSLQSELTVVGDGGIDSLSFDHSGVILAVASASSVIFLDANNGTQLAELPFEQLVYDVAFSPDGRLIAVAHETGTYVGAGMVELWAVF